MYLVTICIPVYNVEKYIKRCAISLFEQTYDNIEYIFVDDCSQDRSIDELRILMEKYPKRYDSVRIIKHSQNRGLAAARNTGIENAHGEFILHVDSDDWISRDAVEKLVIKQKENNADIVEFETMVITRSGNKDYIKFPEVKDKTDHIKAILLDNVMHGVVFRFIRLSLYLQFNIRNIEGANHGEDLYIVPQLIWCAKTIATLHEPLYNYDNTNQNSITGRISLKNINQLRTNQKGLFLFFQGKSEALHKMVEACILKTIVNDLNVLLFYGGNKELVRLLQKERNEIGKDVFKSISLPYYPYLYVNNYFILRVYAIISVKLKRFMLFFYK